MNHIYHLRNYGRNYLKVDAKFIIDKISIAKKPILIDKPKLQHNKCKIKTRTKFSLKIASNIILNFCHLYISFNFNPLFHKI